MICPIFQVVCFAMLLHISGAEEKCDMYLGCYELGKPFHSKLRLVPAPDDTKDVGTSFTLYTRGSKDGKVLTLYPKILLKEAGFDFKKPAVFIVHGFASSKDTPWMAEVKTAYLEKEDANVFITDWKKGAFASPIYLQSASNTRVVGREISRVIREIVANGGKAAEAHCIGHSLGAHCCGYAGKNLTDLGLITALDAAQPAFEDYSEEVHLNPKDAKFVQAIHTNAVPFIPNLGFGFRTPCGHVDFYFNGQGEQPGCDIAQKIKEQGKIKDLKDIATAGFDLIFEVASCSHGRAPEYYIEVLKSKNTFWGLSWEPSKKSEGALPMEDIAVKVKQCDVKTCGPVGLLASQFPFRGTAYVKTTAKPPFYTPFQGSFTEQMNKVIRSVKLFRKRK